MSSEPKIKDCEGHDDGDELDPTTRACKAYVALCCGGGDHHDPYMDGEIEDAIVDILADLIHLADHEGLDFIRLWDKAANHHNEECYEWKRYIARRTVIQAVKINAAMRGASK